uniref:Ribonuclease H-like domain, reverse transcriptase, RNA-dependent DNA polymerase n=1 Tax=Tanacetum cinerariifolium TaxID=118510 RepID=A0A6L2JHF0_TANCI|nr:ribonuclease H-like domain, reverse transcriptase, RNA-dependent DNA polymerase [Tanacetum cinerariifolium]
MTLIEGTRTMLADSFLPTIFWAEKNQANKYASPKEANNSAGTQANEDQGATSEEIVLHEEHFVLPIWSAYLTTVKSSGDKIEKNTDFKTCEKPFSQVEQIFLEELEKLKRQEKEANDAARKETTHENQNAHTNIPNLLNIVSTPLSVAGPSTAFNDGELSYPDDPSMPHLEDIYDNSSEGFFTNSSYDDEGVVYMNKKDEKGVVVRNKSAFLYDKIDEEVYVTQPPIFVDPKFPNKVYKVVKALYGLHQAPRSWYGTFSTFFEQSRYRRGAIDKTLFIKQDKKDIMLVQVYVDDIIFGSTKKYWCAEFEELMENSVKTASKPIETQKPLVKDEESADVDVTPKTSHLQAIKRIFRKSTTGGCQFLGKILISWQCKKQTIMATSTTEAEYVAVAHCSLISWLLTLDCLIYSYICEGRLLEFWASTTIKKVNDVVKLQALVDGTRVVVTEDVIIQALHLDDVDGMECLPNKEIFTELACMGYEKLPPKLTFYKAFFSAQCRKFNFSKYIFDSMVWNMDNPSKFLIVGKVFSGVETPLFATMLVQPQPPAAEEEDKAEVPNAPTPPSPTTASLPPPQDPIPTLAELKQDKHTQALEIVKLEKRVKKLEKKKKSRSSGLKRLRKVGTSQRVKAYNHNVVGAQEDASKQEGEIEAIDADEDITLEVNAAEPTVFDDEEVTMTMAQTLIKMKDEKARLLDEQIAKRFHNEEVEQAAAKEKQEKNDLEKAKGLQQQYKMKHFRGMTFDKVRPIFEREYNKVQTMFKPDKDVEEPKKRVAEETLLQESFKKLKAVEVLGSESTQDTSTYDPQEMSEEDVYNMLEIVPVSEFKVEAL